MRCRAMLYSMKKTAFSDKVELYFVTMDNDSVPKENTLRFPAGGFSVDVYNSTLFERLVAGQQYEIELSIVAGT